MTNIEVLPARRADEALAEITRRSRGLRRRRLAFLGGMPATAVAAAVALVVAVASGDPTAVRTTGVAAANEDGSTTNQAVSDRQHDGAAPASGVRSSAAERTSSDDTGGPRPGESVVVTIPNPITTTTTAPAPNPLPKQRIAYTRIGERNWWQVWVTKTDGSDARQVTTGDEMHLTPTWSPDGKRLAYIENRSVWDPSYLRISALDDSEDRTIATWPQTQRVWALRWSPKGGRLWYALGAQHAPIETAMWSMAVDGSDNRMLFDDVVTFDIASDGEQAAVVRESGDLEIVRPDGSVVRRLGKAASVAWSGDGSRLAVVDGGRAYVMKVDGTARRAVTTPPDGEVDTRVSWRSTRDVLAVERQYGSADACVNSTCSSRGIRLVDVGSATPAEYRLSDSGGSPALAP